MAMKDKGRKQEQETRDLQYTKQKRQTKKAKQAGGTAKQRETSTGR